MIDVFILVQTTDEHPYFRVIGAYPTYDEAWETREAVLGPARRHAADVKAYWDRMNVIRDEIVLRTVNSRCSRPIQDLSLNERKAFNKIDYIRSFRTAFSKDRYEDELKRDLEFVLKYYPADEIDRTSPQWPRKPHDQQGEISLSNSLHIVHETLHADNRDILETPVED
jgi:hypothetical protein